MSFNHSIVELVEASTSELIGKADSWQRVEVGEIASILNGFPWKSEYFSDKSGVPLIRIRDVTTGRTETRYHGSIENGYWINNGDILIGMDGDFNSRVWN